MEPQLLLARLALALWVAFFAALLFWLKTDSESIELALLTGVLFLTAFGISVFQMAIEAWQRRNRRFSLRSMLVGMATAAVLLAAVTWLYRHL